MKILLCTVGVEVQKSLQGSESMKLLWSFRCSTKFKVQKVRIDVSCLSYTVTGALA